MTDHQQQTAFAYADASFTKLAAGAGFIARIGDRVHLGCRPLEGMTGANHSEAAAARLLVEHLIDLPSPPTRIHLLTDSHDVVSKFGMPGVLRPRRPSPEQVNTASGIEALKTLCAESGTELRIAHCKGHSSTGSAKGFLNHCADRLAVLAATGTELSRDVPFDAFWRLRLMECHETLLCEGHGLTHDEAADFLGIGTDVVHRLVEHRHLRPMTDRSLIEADSLLRVRRQIADRGHDIPFRHEPLRPMLGRVDEADSGFGQGRAPACRVRAMVSLVDHLDFIPAVICLEGRDGIEVHAKRFEMTGAQSWETVLEGVMDLVGHRYPDCDRLTVVASDRELLRALNGAGMRGDHPVLDALDERIGRGEITIESHRVPSHWKGWRVRFSDHLLSGIVKTGVEMSCMVEENLYGIITTTAMPPGCEPPWADLAEAPGMMP